MNKDKSTLQLPHCGEILESEFMVPLELSQSDLARAIGVPRARISEIVNGKRAMTADTDLRLCKYLGLSEGYFLRIQERIEILKARRALKRELAAIRMHPSMADRTQKEIDYSR